MKINIDKLYIVYKPNKDSAMADIFNGRSTDIVGLRNQFFGGLDPDEIHGVFTTKAAAQKAADMLWKKLSPATAAKAKASKDKKTRFREFIKELEALSSKHGIAIESIGGVFIFDEPAAIVYDEDHTSGDLIPHWDAD